MVAVAMAAGLMIAGGSRAAEPPTFGTYVAHRLFTFRAAGPGPTDADPAPSVVPGDDTQR